MSSSEVDTIRSQMVHGTQDYFSKELQLCGENRYQYWKQNFISFDKYCISVAENRSRFKKITGVTDERIPFNSLTLHETTGKKALISENNLLSVYRVSWPVFNGVTGTGLWIEPHGDIKAQLIVIPDADQSPEMLAGLIPGIPQESLYALRLADAGCRVIIPVLIDRKDRWSGNPDIRMTNQPHREYVYRRAYELGRHIIGYEVQKILAVVDWFTNETENLPVAVAGYGEGGLIAFYSAAVDTRIDGVLVSGYFQERENLWQEPVYRNVWGLLKEFGDAEIAGLIAPRTLVVEASEAPEIDGPPAAKPDRREVAAPGRIITPSLLSVRKEAARAEKIYRQLGVPQNFKVVVSGDGHGLHGKPEASKELLRRVGLDSVRFETPPISLYCSYIDSDDRMKSQIEELVDHMDDLIKESPEKRKEFWSKADNGSVDQWVGTTKNYREYFWEELTGKMPDPLPNYNIRSRLAYETAKWKGYWIKLDVWPGIIAGGILLISKDLKPNTKYPVVVFQHGLGGLPEPLIDPDIPSPYYSFGSKLAEEGYIVYAPQNIYGLLIDEPYNQKSFRLVQRMANPLKQSVFSITIGQHQQTLRWLKQLSFTDSSRIGFYGLSYGGKSAMRIPPVLKDYKVVICSGDFNEWVWKLTSLDFAASNMFVQAYEIFEFNLANTFNYAEMAGLIAPRPFMVERGHWDAVAPDEWVAYEYAKVRRLYVSLGIPDRTDIEFFDGPHEIHGVGTLKFLNKYLKNN
jgi:dienelactone hydrolase